MEPAAAGTTTPLAGESVHTLPAPAEPVRRSRSVLEQLHDRGADVMLDAGEGVQPKDMPLSSALQEMMVRFYSYERFSIPVLRELDNRLVDLEHWVLTQSATDKWKEESVARITSEMRREMRTLMHCLKGVHEARLAVQNIAENISRKRKHPGGDEVPGKRVASEASVYSDSSTSTVVMSEEQQQAPDTKAQPETQSELTPKTAEIPLIPPPTPPKTTLAPEPSPLSRLARTLSNRSQAQAREQEAREQQEKERKEKERAANEEKERRAKEERECQAKEEERRVKEEQERLAKEDEERRAKDEQERLAKEDKERRVKEEQERLAQEEQERQARECEAQEAEERVRRAVEERLAAERATFERELERERLERERLEQEIANKKELRSSSPPPAPPVLIGARTSPSHAQIARDATGGIPMSSSQREIALLNGGVPAVPSQRPKANANASSGLRARAHRYLESSNATHSSGDENSPIERAPVEQPKANTLEQPKGPTYSPSPLSESLRRRIALFENQN